MHNPYEDEARARWGDTEAWKQSASRTARYTGQDWAEVQREADALTERYADVYRSDAAANSPEAMDTAEAHRMHIHERFYDLAPEMHVALGQMYVNDPRFTEHYDSRKPGLATFVRDAIEANAARHASA